MYKYNMVNFLDSNKYIDLDGQKYLISKGYEYEPIIKIFKKNVYISSGSISLIIDVENVNYRLIYGFGENCISSLSDIEELTKIFNELRQDYLYIFKHLIKNKNDGRSLSV